MTDVARHAPDPGTARSPHWPAVEHAHLSRQPCCQACGGKHDLNVHHVRPFHLYPERELDDDNLITLCRFCHLVFGHFHDWKSFNVQVVSDAHDYHRRLLRRPAA